MPKKAGAQKKAAATGGAATWAKKEPAPATAPPAPPAAAPPAATPPAPPAEPASEKAPVAVPPPATAALAPAPATAAPAAPVAVAVDTVEEEVFEDCEGLDDPLALLGGMGEEEVYKVTLVPEAPAAEAPAAEAPAVEAPVVEAAGEAPRCLETEAGGCPERERPAPAADAEEPQPPVPPKLEADCGSEGDATRTGGSGSSPRSNAGSETCRVTALCDSTKPGDCLAILGSDPALGQWNTSKVVKLTTSAATWPMWSGELPAPAPGSEYKLVILGAGGEIAWEPLQQNRTWPRDATSGALATYGK